MSLWSVPGDNSINMAGPAILILLSSATVVMDICRKMSLKSVPGRICHINTVILGYSSYGFLPQDVSVVFT